MAYPSTVTSFTNPTPDNRLNSPSHSSIETAQNLGLTQIMNAVGTDASIIGTVIGDLRNPASDGGGHVQSANKGGTGQTIYNKGDILVAQNSSTLTKLAVGANAAVLTADSTTAVGVKWGAPSPGIPTSSIFTTPGSIFAWRIPSIYSYLLVEVQGGGGGGAGIAGGGTGDSGGGGGGGAYAYRFYPASIFSGISSVLITVASTASGGNSGANSGTDGNFSSFFIDSGVTSIKSGGGLKGNTSGGSGGAGGISSGGDFNYPGQSGTDGLSASARVRMTFGGNSFYGFGGRRGDLNAGENGQNYGGGGGGAAFISGNRAGGTGAQGLVKITIY